MGVEREIRYLKKDFRKKAHKKWWRNYVSLSTLCKYLNKIHTCKKQTESTQTEEPLQKLQTARDNFVNGLLLDFDRIENHLNEILQLSNENFLSSKNKALVLANPSKDLPPSPSLPSSSSSSSSFSSSSSSSSSQELSGPVKKKIKDSVLSDFHELYSDLSMLQDFQDLNNELIQKLLDLYEFITEDPFASDGLKEARQQKTFFSTQKISELLEDINEQYKELKGIDLKENPLETPFLDYDDDEDEDDLEEIFSMEVATKSAQLEKESQVVKFKAKVACVAAVLFFIALCASFMLPEEDRRAGRASALILFVTIFWVFEPIPFFVTGLCIPVLTVFLFILAEENECEGETDEERRLLNATEASVLVYKQFFNSTVALVLGGFSIAVAFRKCDFHTVVVGLMQQWLGERPRSFLVAFLFSAFFLSAWISNVASPLLMGGIFLPVIRSFPRTSRYVRAMVLGLAFASNLGGMLTPVASPQNAVVYGFVNENYPDYRISFLEWMLVAVPFGLAGFFVLIMFILFYLQPNDVAHIPPLGEFSLRMDKKRKFVLSVTIMTIILWMSLPWTSNYIGNTGNVGFLPLCLFLSFGVLTKDDFISGFSWNLIFLLGGGQVLGMVVENSGLLYTLAEKLESILILMSPWAAVVIITVAVAGITTFVSHTVAAIILIPVVTTVGISIGEPRLLIMTTILMDCGSMTLPMTSFPNVNSILMEDKKGEPYLKVKHFVQYGGFMTVVVIILLSTLGYALMGIVLGDENVIKDTA